MLPEKALHELQGIIHRDYGVVVSDADAEELGVSLLQLTRVALAVLARKKDAQEVERLSKLSDTQNTHDKESK